MIFQFLRGKINLRVWRKNIIVYFGGKTKQDYAIFRNCDFAILMEKHDFTIVTGKCDFCGEIQ